MTIFEKNLMLELSWNRYSAREVAQLCGDSANTIPEGEYEMKPIRVSDTDLYRKGLLDRKVFAGDDGDGYHTDRLDAKAGHEAPPIVAIPKGDAYEIIDGHHRLVGAQEQGKKLINAFVKVA
jgi:hypothetical protein